MPLTEETRGDLLELTLDRPEAYNAIDPELRDALIDALRRAEQDGRRAIVIRGAGRGFCSGIDLKGSNADTRMLDVVTLMRTSM